MFRLFDNRKVQLALFLFLLFAFCYFRLKPIYLQTVPYTYDQGRDFLKAQELVTQRHLTFIGPTTDIGGLFHGAWWYYFLAIVYFIFNGWPLGFYISIFLISTLSVLFFLYFLKKEFGNISPLLFFSIVSVSSYFTFISFFAANNILAPPFVLLFIFSLYRYFKDKKNKYLFLLTLSIGFILETEFSFGLYLIPAFFITLLFFKQTRNIFLNLKKLTILLSGFIIPITPRLLFEVKNHFIQTKSVLSFLNHGSATNQQAFIGALRERINVFIGYNQDIFSIKLIFYFFILVAFYFLFFKSKSTQGYIKQIIHFLLSIVFFIYTISFIGKNSFFWGNYLEGIQYIFLFIFILIINSLQKNSFFHRITQLLILIYLFLNLFTLEKSIYDKSFLSMGLKAEIQNVQYLYKQVGKNDFCLHVYTPPVTPYTYRYLLSYYARTKQYKIPKEGFVGGKCWYVFDQEPYGFRVVNWRKDYIPKDAKFIKSALMDNNTNIELWEE